MIGGTLQIDQSPCRASYGLLPLVDFWRDTADRARAKVLEGIGEIAAEGDRLARAYSPANYIEEIAAEKYLSSQPPDVVLVHVASPIINYTPSTGSQVDIMA